MRGEFWCVACQHYVDVGEKMPEAKRLDAGSRPICRDGHADRIARALDKLVPRPRPAPPWRRELAKRAAARRTQKGR